MKKLILSSVAASALMLSLTVSAQEAEKETTSFISEQIANVSVELFNLTKATVVETLTSWSKDALAAETNEAASKDESKAEPAVSPENK